MSREMKPITFELANGCLITVELSPEQGADPGGFGLRVFAERGTLIVKPGMENSLTISTARSYAAGQKIIDAEHARAKATKKDRIK